MQIDKNADTCIFPEMAILIKNVLIYVYRRTKSLGTYDDYDDYDEEGFFENDNSYVNWERHEYCYDEFEGYGFEYDGPRGVLTSFLPDGSSISPTKSPTKTLGDVGM